MSEKIFAEAINEAIAEEMRRDENVLSLKMVFLEQPLALL